jgi:PRC-barrel domain
MPSVKRRASKILDEYGAAQSELIGKAVVLTDGKAGTVVNVWLDELHGLRISIEGHEGRWPVSTIKLESSPRIGYALPRSRAPFSKHSN